MPSPKTVSQSRTFPVPPDRAFERTLSLPLEQLFESRFGPIPSITGTDQDGAWSSVGQERTIHTADGGTMRERLTAVDAPGVFRYEITDVTGPMKPLVARIEGTWAFDPVGTGCRITWTSVIHPVSAASALALPVFARLWQAYARRSLDHLEDLLLAA